RPVCRRLSFNSCLLLVLLVGFACLPALTRKAGAGLIARGFSTSDQALVSAPNIELATRARLREGYGRLPLSFEANQGQTNSSVKFLSRGSGYNLFLRPTEAVLRLETAERKAPNDEQNKRLILGAVESKNPKSTVLRMKFTCANTTAKIAGVKQEQDEC